MAIETMSKKVDSATNGITTGDIPYGDTMWLRRVYDKFNKLYFNNSLPKNIRFEWSNRMKVTAGSCHYTTRNKKRVPETIKISVPYMKKHPQEIYEVMIHEMIHARYPEAGHGPVFYSELERVNSMYNLKVSRHTKNRGIRPHVYGCKACKRQFSRANRFNVSHFKCGTCGGVLEEKTKNTGGQRDVKAK